MDRRRHFLQTRKQWKNADTPTTFCQTSHKQSYQEVVDLDLSQVLLVMFFIGWGLEGFFRSCYSCRLGISPDYRAHLTGDYETLWLKCLITTDFCIHKLRETIEKQWIIFALCGSTLTVRGWTRIEINSGRRVISKLFRCFELSKTITNTGCVVLLTNNKHSKQ